MAEVVVGHILGVDVVDPDVQVQTGLDVVLGNTAVFESAHCLPRTEYQRLVLRRHPTALHLRRFLLVCLPVGLADQIC